MAKKIALFLACVLFVAMVYTASAEQGADDIHVVTKASDPGAQPKLGSQECVQLCEQHCKSWRKKKACVHPCTACCNKLQCVPLKISKCDNWTSVTSKKGEVIKCPK